MWDDGLDIVRCAGCCEVIAHHEHLWIEDEDGGPAAVVAGLGR